MKIIFKHVHHIIYHLIFHLNRSKVNFNHNHWRYSFSALNRFQNYSLASSLANLMIIPDNYTKVHTLLFREVKNK